MKNNASNRKLLYFSIICLIIVIAVISGTYAYFSAKKTAENVLIGETKTLSFGLAVEKITNNDTYGLIPLDDEKAPLALENMCTDMNGYAICQIYKMTVRNTGNTDMYLDGYLTLKTVNDDEMRFIRIYYDGDEYCFSENCVTDFNIENVKDGIVTDDTGKFDRVANANALFVESDDKNDGDKVLAGETANYYALVWLHNLNEEQNDLQGVEHFFSGQATFISAQGNEITAVF